MISSNSLMKIGNRKSFALDFTWKFFFIKGFWLCEVLPRTKIYQTENYFLNRILIKKEFW